MYVASQLHHGLVHHPAAFRSRPKHAYYHGPLRGKVGRVLNRIAYQQFMTSCQPKQGT